MIVVGIAVISAAEASSAAVVVISVVTAAVKFSRIIADFNIGGRKFVDESGRNVVLPLAVDAAVKSGQNAKAIA